MTSTVVAVEIKLPEFSIELNGNMFDSAFLAKKGKRKSWIECFYSVME